MNESKIEWTDATWNPVRGCSRMSEGCRNCYAERVAARFSDQGAPFAGFAKRVGGEARWTGRVELVPEALDWPLRVHRPAWVQRAEAEGRRPRIFVNSMSDLFHGRLSDEAIAAVFGVMASAPRFDFLVLTKRAERMRAWCSGWVIAGIACRMPDWPLPNVWLGVSVEDQATADERIPHLLSTPAAIRFVSYEPALAAVDFGRWIFNRGAEIRTAMYGLAKLNRDQAEAVIERPLDWLIVGGESGPGARPFDPAWARSAVAQCRAAGVPVFVKQLGARPGYKARESVLGALPGPDAEALEDRGDGWHTWILRDRKGGDMSEWPEDLRVREFPNA